MGPEPDSPQLNEPSAAGAGAETATTGRPPVVVAWLTPLLIIAGACTAGAGSRDGDPTSPSSVNGSGGAGGSSGSGGASAAQGGGLNLGGHGPTAVGCTADLQATVDDQGNIVEQCPPDKGCLEGVCVPACEAAAASKGSIGCEYYVPYPPFYQNNTSPNSYDGACHAMFVANTWGRHAQLTANYGGQSYDVTSFARIPSGVAQATQYMPLPALGLPPGEVAVLFLSHKPGAAHSLGSSLECPITPAVTIDTAAHNSGVATAFEVISDTPITGYDIMPYGGAQSYLPSASLLYPRTAWGTNYYAIAPANPSLGQQWLLVVGTADNTTVEIVAPVTLPAGTGVPAATANTLTPITLGAGELVQWMGADPSGSVLQSSAPIGVWGGNTYLRVPSATSSGGGAQDSAHQQIPPISALGSEYVGGGVVSRLSSLSPESVPYRLLGVVDGTQLTWDPPVGSAPATLDAGQVVEMETASLVRVSSQDEDHPFAFSQYMPGCPGVTIAGCGPSPPNSGVSCGLGDEEWVMVPPPNQYLQRYVFFTDPTYATTNLVITRVAGTNGFEDVEIECLGTVTDWQAVGSSGQYQVAHVDLIRGAVGVTPECATSRHVATSVGSFGVMVWGTDFYASYGYPAGGNVGAINDVVVVPVPN